MHQQLVVVLLVGLAASAYGLDLSHATRSADQERIFGFITDLYQQVIYPPLNHITTNFALLAAQALAGFSQTGLPGGPGRALTDSEVRGFWDDLWNNGVKPQLDGALSGLALTLAQTLANIGVNGINLGIGKRSVVVDQRGFFDDLINNVLAKPLNQAIQTLALLGAQALAGIGANGNIIDLLGGIGKSGSLSQEARVAELRGIFDGFGDALVSGLQTVWNNVLSGPATQALQTLALLGAQGLAGAGASGNIIDTLSSLFGKRDLEAEPRGPIIDGLLDHATGLYHDQVKPLLNDYLSAAAIHLAGILANISGGVGK